MPDLWTRGREAVLKSRRVLSIAVQLLVVVVSNWVAFNLRFDGDVPPNAMVAFWQMLPWLVAIRAFVFVPFRLYEGLWRYTSIYDLRALIGGISLSSLLFFAFTHSPLRPPFYPRSVYITDAIVLAVLLSGIRLTRRLTSEFGRTQRGTRVLIVGAGNAGELIVRDMKNNAWYAYQPVGFIDDNRAKVGLRIHGVPVLGTRQDLPEILERHKPAEVLIAISRADPATIRSLVRALEPYKIPIKTLPNLHDLLHGKVDVAQIRSLVVEDLLTRAPVGLDPRPLQRLIAGRRVMVTGAGGSIGSELCRQIARLKPSALLMFERYENTLHEIRLELDDQHPSFAVLPIVGDVGDEARVNDVLARHRPEIIFHAAAHKHVPLMEENPCEAVKNNVRGTRLLAKAAEQHGTDRFILISTDKAVNPSSVMGASKRLAELAVQLQSTGSGTSFSIVRFGNVLGSNGSVVPRFLEQIRNGGPVTITHPEMRRFFMLIPEAVQLVLHAASHATGGTTYVLDMGEQVKVLDIARNLIRLSGLVPDQDIKFEFIGLRPGEKMFEELVGPTEDVTPSQIDKILCVRSRQRPAPSFATDLDVLDEDARRGDTEAVLRRIRELVGGFSAATGPTARPDAAPQATPVPTVPLAAPFAEGEQPCPACRTGRVHRSRARTLPEKIRRGLTSRRLFRCDACDWRGWLRPLQFTDARPAEAVSVPELTSLDVVGTSSTERSAPTFSPRDLV